jgi:DNA-binding NarL/FixJ family response regulator
MDIFATRISLFMNRIKVLLVDDHALVRDSIAIMLAQTVDIQIVGRLSNGEELINKVRDLQPDIIIMDIFLRGISRHRGHPMGEGKG